MTFLSLAENNMTLPNDIQADAQTACSSQLFVKCPGVCRRHIDLERVKLAGGGRNRTVWNCKICRLMNKKQVKVTWYHLICVQCTQTHGKTCLIQYCASNCPTKQAIVKKKALQPSLQKDLEPSLRYRKFRRAKRFIKCLTRDPLLERLKVLRSAWILGDGDVSQPWLECNGARNVLISKLHDGFAAFEADPSVPLPVGFQKALAENFNVDKTQQDAKLWSDWKTTVWKEWKAQRKKMRRDRAKTGKAAVFKYDNEMYQSVKHFCDNYKGLKNNNSRARAHVVKTDYPLSTYLVVPGHSTNNYRHIPKDWKNGTQDLRELEGVAYILGQGSKPTGSHLLLVSQKELNQAAESAILSSKQSAKSRIPRKQPAKVLDRQQSSRSVLRAKCKCK